MIVRLALSVLFCFSFFFVHSQSRTGKHSNKSDLENRLNLYNERIDKLSYELPDSALFYASKSLTLARNASHKNAEAIALLKTSKIYYIKGVYGASLAYALKGLKLSQQTGYEQGTGLALNSIGLVYLAQDRLDDAQREFERSMNVSLKTADNKMLCRNYFNIGLTYDEKKNSQQALKYLGKALELAEQIGDKTIQAMSYNRIGESYYRTGQYFKALGFYQMVIKPGMATNDWERSFAYSGIAQSYQALKQYDKAIQNAMVALDLLKTLNAKWDIERCLNILHQSHEALGDYRNAYHYLKLDKIYSDSLFNEEKETEINALHLGQKLSENAQLQNENQTQAHQLLQKKKTIAVISAMVVLLIISKGLIFWFYRQKGKLNRSLAEQSESITAQNAVILRQNKELEELNSEKDQLFSVIGHDLRSPFASILQAMTLLKEGDLTIEETKVFLDGFFDHLTSSASMLDNLVHWAQSQQEGIKAFPQMFDVGGLVKQLLSVSKFQIQEKQLQIINSVIGNVDVYCDPDHARIIIHNLLGNAIKFTPRSGRIEISCEVFEDNTIIYIKDNGMGMTAEKIQQLFKVSGKRISSYGTNNEKGIGIGLMLVKRFASENDLIIDVISNPGSGTEFGINFPRFTNRKG